MDNKKACNVCSKTEGQLLQCGGCKLVWYCSVDCQRKDWKEHKKVCSYQPVKKEEPKPEEPRSRADDFVLISKCGVGNFSEIWKVEDKEDRSKVYALKIVNKKRVTSNHKEKDILMEKHCLKVLEDSDYVIRLYETFKDELNVYFLMEYMEGGELWEHLKTFGLVAQSLIKYYYCHLLKAVQSIHSRGIVHRDLKVKTFVVC
jgi:Serine/threonine protein kinase